MSPGTSTAALLMAVWLGLTSAGDNATPPSTPTPSSTTQATSPSTPVIKPSPPTDTKPCQGQPPTANITLPELDDEYIVGIEATILQRNYTVEVVEYYSKTLNKGAVVKTQNGTQSTILYHFDNLQMFIIQDGKCQTDDIRNGNGFQFFNYTHSGGHGHIGNVADVLKFGSKYNETYVESSVVRGMPVDHWTSCLKWDRYNAAFSMDYYFTKPNYTTPVRNQPIPARVVLKGIGKNPDPVSLKVENFSHIYDFVFYKPGPIKDTSVFEIPAGVVCKGVVTQKSQPRMPDRFSVSLEVVDSQNHFLQVARIYYDYSANLARFDHKPSRRDDSKMGKAFGYRSIKVIEDFHTGLEYVIDKEQDNCTVQVLTGNATGAQISSQDPNHVVMKHVADILLLTQINLTYQGVRNYRDIPVDVWAGVDKQNSTWEVYYLASDGDWTFEAGKLDEESQVLLGVRWEQPVEGEDTNVRLYNYYNYEEEAPDTTAFDISACFDKKDQMKHVIFRLKGSYDQLVSGKLHIIQPAVRQAISKAAEIPQIRIHDIYFDSTSNDYVDVWMTILDKPYLAGMVAEIDVVGLEKAFNNLKSKVDGPGFTIKLTESSSVMTVPKSVATSEEAFDPRQPTVTNVNQGHSDGSMAALGIFMLVLGVVLGVGVLFLLRKRITGIPYQLQE